MIAYIPIAEFKKNIAYTQIHKFTILSKVAK